MKYIFVSFLILFSLLANESKATTYYVRPDGGNHSNCDGKADLPVPGKNGHCAWNHPFEAFPPKKTARISGGDTLVIKNGSYRMGYTPGLYDKGPCSRFWPWDCHMSSIPSGLDAKHPTKILGEGWDKGCSNPPELWGTNSSSYIINLIKTNNVEIQCLNITDHAECGNNHGGKKSTRYRCIKGRAPTGDWAASGIYILSSKNGLLKNISIHGLSSFAIKTGNITDWTFDHVNMIGNGYGGFSNDAFGSHKSKNRAHGKIVFKNGKIDWNGCIEKYPNDGQPFQCYDQNQGGYGDGLGTDVTTGTWIFDRMNVSFNTSDGIDLLYHGSDKDNIIIKNSYFDGNVGNSIKTNGNAVIVNNVLIGNCDYFNPSKNPFSIPPLNKSVHLTTCRGNATSSHTLTNGSHLVVANNSFTGQADIILTISGKNKQNGNEKATIVNNIFYGGPHFHDKEKVVDGIFNWQVRSDFKPVESNNLFYHTKREFLVCGGESKMSICGKNPLYKEIDFEKEKFDFSLQKGSPAFGAGLPARSFLDTVAGMSVFVPDKDITGKKRKEKVSLGAYED